MVTVRTVERHLLASVVLRLILLVAVTTWDAEFFVFLPLLLRCEAQSGSYCHFILRITITTTNDKKTQNTHGVPPCI